MNLFISCPKGLEYLLEEELKALGLAVNRVSPQGVYGTADLAGLYQICIWSRIANRVQLLLFSGEAHNEQTIYKLCHQYPWQTLFAVECTLAIEFHGSSPKIRNTMYGAQVVKDAVVDYFYKLQKNRPTIDREKPHILLHAHLKHDTLTVSLDLIGYSLHQRGYRIKGGKAPLKENVAAALLMRAGWPRLAAQGYDLHDPFCGSGTLVIEAAMMAAHIAPGLLRNDQALSFWRGHQSSLWEKMRAHALKQVTPVTQVLQGSDYDKHAIAMAVANAERAGVARLVQFTQQEVTYCKPSSQKGLVVSNLPYGERLGDALPLIPLYQQFGEILHERYQGWQVAWMTSNPLLAKATGVRASKQYALYNGAIACKLYCAHISGHQHKKAHLSEGAQMFANRLQKNGAHLRKWAKRKGIECYRVYDADLPEYAFAIDVYKDYAILQEYVAPASIPAHKAEQRSLEVMQVVPKILGVSPSHLVVKQRKPQKGSNQYQKMDKTRHALIVQEGKARLKVNIYDYLDTGLFLDHRPLRLRFESLSPGTRFLNCFCYTATASVHASLAGALTTNVDLSKTYLDWAKDNFVLNELKLSQHQFIQKDCMAWLNNCRDKFDVIFLDPPGFSNSKRMTQVLDIQRDHETLIRAAMRLLNTDGVLYFSTNLRRFKLSPIISGHYDVQDISAETIDEDFKRNPRIHQCFLLRNSCHS